MTIRVLRQFATVPHSQEVETWLTSHAAPLGAIARHWFAAMRAAGGDVREVMHDGHAAACLQDAPFAYVAVFKAHVNVGFYRGAALPDPAHLLRGTGKYMRHVRISPSESVDSAALTALVHEAYADMRACLDAESHSGAAG